MKNATGKLPLTKRQHEVFVMIRGFIIDNGYAPRLQDIADMIGTRNISTAQYFVDELVRKGYFKKVYYRQQGLIMAF